MIGPMLASMTGWFLGAFARLFSVLLSHYTATKIVLGVLFLVGLPIVINNILYDLMDIMFQVIGDFTVNKTPELNDVSFTGLLGYFCEELGIIDALSVVLSAMSLRFALSWIPFIGPK